MQESTGPVRRAALVRVLACGLAALAGAWPCWAATQTVTNINDSGSGSLRQAIANAAPGDTINFQLPNPSVITLSSTLMINTNLTIQGPGAAQLAIDGNRASQVLRVGMTVTISGLTIQNGTAPFGAGIENLGTLTVENSILSGNSASANGGGIFNDGALTVMNSTISGNSAQYGGGYGGGIENFFSGTLTVTNSTLLGNSASTEGGGINNDGTLTVTNSTLSGNSAPGGGGVRNAGRATVTNSTLSGNSAPVDGGGIYNDSTLTAKGILLASNQGGNCANLPITSQGYNLSDDATCAPTFRQTGDENNVTPGAGLDPKGLQNNGGPTQTIALLPNSPAVDAIPGSNCTDTQGNKIATDQRGVTRPQGSGCDIGAFELVQNTPFSYFNAKLAILTGKPSGFALTARLSLGSASDGIHPLTEAVTLQVANYTVTIPAGSFHQLWNNPLAPYAYAGTINGTKVIVGLVSLGDNNYQFDAVGLPVAFSAGIKNPVTVSLSIGDDTGSTPVTAFINVR